MYDPVIGRFISPDNVIPDQYNPQSLNRYSYCLNNPLIYTDPSGHSIGTHITRPVSDSFNIVHFTVGGVNAAVVGNEHGYYIIVQTNQIIQSAMDLTLTGVGASGQMDEYTMNEIGEVRDVVD